MPGAMPGLMPGLALPGLGAANAAAAAAGGAGGAAGAAATAASSGPVVLMVSNMPDFLDGDGVSGFMCPALLLVLLSFTASVLTMLRCVCMCVVAAAE